MVSPPVLPPETVGTTGVVTVVSPPVLEPPELGGTWASENAGNTVVVPIIRANMRFFEIVFFIGY